MTDEKRHYHPKFWPPEFDSEGIEEVVAEAVHLKVDHLERLILKNMPDDVFSALCVRVAKEIVRRAELK